MKIKTQSRLQSSALRGFALAGMQSIVTKGVTIATQFALSWFLLPEDFGLVGLAYTVSTLANACTQIGLREFIVRSRHTKGWIEPALWAGFSISIVSALLMSGASLVAAALYDQPRIIGLTLVLAAGAPFSMLHRVLSASLQKRFCFSQLAMMGVCSVLLNSALSILFASQGFGSYAFVAPVPLTAALQCVILWRLCGVRMSWRPRIGLWPHFLPTGSYIFLIGLLTTISGQADYILLGAFHTAADVGLYFFAFSVSTQMSRFLWESFNGVLFPLLASVKDDSHRLMGAFQRTVGATAMFIVPVTMLQAILAEPLIKIFFAERWAAAIPMIQLMSIGIGLHTIAEPCVPLLQAQGRFRDLLKYTLGWFLLLVPTIYVSARFGGSATVVAAAVAVFYVVASPIYFYFVIRKVGGNLRDVMVIYLPSACASLIAGAVSAWSGQIVGLGSAWSLPIVAAVFVAIYVALAPRLSPRMWREALGLVRNRVSREAVV